MLISHLFLFSFYYLSCVRTKFDSLLAKSLPSHCLQFRNETKIEWKLLASKYSIEQHGIFYCFGNSLFACSIIVVPFLCNCVVFVRSLSSSNQPPPQCSRIHHTHSDSICNEMRYNLLSIIKSLRFQQFGLLHFCLFTSR